MTQVKRATRKIYLSIIFVTLSLLTMVATTFAWVGIVSNTSFERISINLETDNEKSDYGVMLSLTGDKNDFHDSIDALALQKQLLINIGVPESKLNNEVNIRNLFSQIKLAQCTTIRDTTAADCAFMKPFQDLYGNKPYASLLNDQTEYKGYFEFDVYVSIYKIGEDADGSENKLSIYLRNGDAGGLFSSSTSSAYIPNEIVMPNSSNPLSTEYLKSINNFEPGKKIKGMVNINPASAARLSVQKGKSVLIGKNTLYDNHDYQGLKIYKYGSDVPSYDNKYDLYDFGGILPSDFNFARLQYNSTHPANDQLGAVPERAINRGDITFEDDGDTNHIVTPDDNVTTQDMICLHFSFWFEGWDSDCFEAINDKQVSVNINFSTKNPNEA